MMLKQLLIDAKADVNTRDNEGYTALMYTAGDYEAIGDEIPTSNEEIMELLIEREAGMVGINTLMPDKKTCWLHF